MSIVGKTILITGGGSGLGAASALYLASKGANVVITGRNESNLKAIAAQAPVNGGKVVPIAGDATDEEDVQRVVTTTAQWFGSIDAVILNAGWEGPGVQDPTEANIGDIKQLLDINILAPIIGAKFSIPHLIRSKGTLVLVSSVVSVVPSGTSYPLYATTKAACDALVRQFGALYSPKGVHVFGVNPVFYESPMSRSVVSARKTQQKVALTTDDVAALWNPLGHIGDPIDFGPVYNSFLTDTHYKSGDSILVFPSLTPGKPITTNIDHFYTNVIYSSTPNALHQSYLSLPLHDAKGAPLPDAEAAKVQTHIKTHVTAVLAKLAPKEQ